MALGMFEVLYIKILFGCYRYAIGGNKSRSPSLGLGASKEDGKKERINFWNPGHNKDPTRNMFWMAANKNAVKTDRI